MEYLDEDFFEDPAFCNDNCNDIRTTRTTIYQEANFIFDKNEYFFHLESSLFISFASMNESKGRIFS